MTIRWLGRHRFWVASAMLVALMAIGSSRGYWHEDFWEHAAAVRELATQPLRPHHPLFQLDSTPHVYFTPYHHVVAVLARVLSLAAEDALAVFGVLNLLLWLAGLRRFIGAFFGSDHDRISFYALLLILLLSPAAVVWNWSGFFHFGVLGGAMPYPATFATGATFLLLSLLPTWLVGGGRARLLRLALLAGLAAVILLAHPPTAGFAFAGIVAVSWSAGASRGRRVLAGATLVAGGIGLALLWPQFSILEMARVANPGFQGINSVLYRRLLRACYPVLIALPMVLVAFHARRAEHRSAPLLIMIAIMAAAYAAGYLAGQHMLGRLLSPLSMIVQIGVAMIAAEWEERVRRGARRWLLPLCGLGLALAALNRPNVAVLRRIIVEHPSTYADFLFLRRWTGQYDVVLSDLKTSWLIPAFGGKIVASYHPMHFVADYDDRRADLERFLREGTSTAERWSILRRYRVDYLALHKGKEADRQRFEPFGPVTYQNATLELREVAWERAGEGDVPSGARR
ncbi:MAG: hypothetical protein JRI23_17165 [Deltaproteobacteria bacterium]|jgi:general stress protein CsbA|nr:hypothetical protein [Deltaproteobacteria bacterium]MBW2533545.1 hypothetical protein [Deltaproteobacteria bacterium]